MEESILLTAILVFLKMSWAEPFGFEVKIIHSAEVSKAMLPAYEKLSLKQFAVSYRFIL